MALTTYTQEMADIICECLIEGFSLRSICATEGFPNRSTVLRWLDERPEFATKYARARTMQADLMDDMILDAAAATTSENAAAQRVKIAAYQWRASKLKPKVYGDLLKLGDPAGEAIKFTSERSADDRARAMALMVAKRGADGERRTH